MTTLHQIIAIEKGEKTRAERKLTEVDRTLSKSDLLQGISRQYRPKDDEGEQLPPEEKLVQVRVEEALDEAEQAMTKLWNIVATKEVGNRDATADLVVNGQVLLESVPVTLLLFLEKELVSIRTLINRLPTLPAGVEWDYDENVAAYASKPAETHRTKRVPRSHIKWEPPTSEYSQPAQVEMYHEDEVVGYWTKVDYSGAMPADRVKHMLARVEELQRAVKFAREQANDREVDEVEIGKRVFDYIFRGGS